MASPEPELQRKRPIAGVGRVVVWPGASIWVGRQVGSVPEHAHHAIQVSLALDGPFQIQARAWQEPIETRSAVVMPDEPHRLDGLGNAVAMIFVEPNSNQGAAIRKRFARLDIGALLSEDAERTAAPLREAFDLGVPDERLARLAQGAICRIAGDPQTAPRSDARITAALEWMRAHLAEPVRLQDAADAVHLSPGRFRHLFVAQTGTSFSAWLLWARAEAAIAAATRGTNWTDAAQEAGFADAAHFTRTCRRVFGVTPTMLVFAKPAGKAAR
jgi:AraC-like DNA-binding protein